jgi:iron complex transport system ATP-binding protein
MNGNTTLLEIQDLTVCYGERTVLQDVSLEVGPGEIVALIGPNGAGKTTLFRAVSGVVPPRSGRVFARGVDLAGLSIPERARYLAVVPQARRLPAGYSVQQTVLLGRTPYLGWLGKPAARDLQRTRQALERIQIAPLVDRPVDELSGGEQQLVLLARALAQDTPILILDEPTAHLDLHHQGNLLRLVRELADEQGLGVLMALHDLNLVSLYADRVALLAEGRLQATGSAAEVLTEANLGQAYRVPVHVSRHPLYGTPLVLPDGRSVEKLER